MSGYHAIAGRLRSMAREMELLIEVFGHLDSNLIDDLKGCAESITALSESASQQRRIDPLPPAQARVLTFVRLFINEHSWPPTRQEIATALGFKSANGAQEHLKRLEQRGVITLIEGAARGIRINKRGIVARSAP